MVRGDAAVEAIKARMGCEDREGLENRGIAETNSAKERHCRLKAVTLALSSQDDLEGRDVRWSRGPFQVYIVV
jgi:hypothetical protein